MSFERRNGDKTHKKHPFTRLLKLIIWIILIVGIIQYMKYTNFVSKPLIQETREISIRAGDSYEQIGSDLEINELFLKIYTKNNPPADLKVGNYMIPKDATISEIFESLQKPIFKEQKVVILEGWNIFDIDQYLTEKGLIPQGKYIEYVENPEKITALKEFFPFIGEIETLEGYLYPDTYNIDPSTFAINKFVISQLETFEKKVYEKLFLDRSDISIENMHSVINLASIVEKEEKNPANKKIVAGILKKRLKEYWYIGADITVCYPYKLTSEECKFVVSKYIDEKNEYNTRKKLGLPKTPIGNPSYSTIEATLNHESTSYYYYLHDKNGGIHYADTNEQHVQNKYKYLR